MRIAEDSPRFYSSVSTVEISVKHASGKLPLPGRERFPEVFGEMGFSEMPLNSRHAAGMLKFRELNGRDPFDRLLIAQANDNRCTFLTGDEFLLGLGLPWIVDARL